MQQVVARAAPTPGKCAAHHYQRRDAVLLGLAVARQRPCHLAPMRESRMADKGPRPPQGDACCAQGDTCRCGACCPRP
eukprot:14335131-Alexandrium_andersonii.AAC.1